VTSVEDILKRLEGKPTHQLIYTADLTHHFTNVFDKLNKVMEGIAFGFLSRGKV